MQPALTPASRRAALSGLLKAGLLSGLTLFGRAAPALGAPRGRVLLTINGRLARPNADGRGEFDMDMLAALPQRSFTQKTPWYPQARKFTGPLLRDVLAAVGAEGRVIEALALNDYKVSIPFEDVQQHAVLLARLIDDQPMPIRDKGPLFIIYPFGEDERLRTNVYFSRSAWQLRQLDIKP